MNLSYRNQYQLQHNLCIFTVICSMFASRNSRHMECRTSGRISNFYSKHTTSNTCKSPITISISCSCVLTNLLILQKIPRFSIMKSTEVIEILKIENYWGYPRDWFTIFEGKNPFLMLNITNIYHLMLTVKICPSDCKRKKRSNILALPLWYVRLQSFYVYKQPVRC